MRPETEEDEYMILSMKTWVMYGQLYQFTGKFTEIMESFTSPGGLLDLEASIEGKEG